MVKGKPVLEPMVHQNLLEFSSAGSNGCCLFGISTSGQLGVDLEMEGRRTSNPHSLARRYFSKREQDGFARLEGHELDRAFLHTWACKEAVVKAAGHGIANQLDRFTVSIDPNKNAQMLEIDGGKPEDWQLNMVKPAAGFVACLALRHPKLRFEGFKLGPVSAGQDG